MKTGIIAPPTIHSNDMVKSIMGMSPRGMEIATYFMRDKIYTDKIGAVIREYICNARDEHKKYNINIPVVVTIDKKDNDYCFSVRDYALGLSENGIRNVFGMYFESTKGNSNECVGGFGIGSKSAFSYTDTFFVNSYHNGTLTKYVCTLGGGVNGIPVGEIYKISEEPTDEQGIEISLNINYSDKFDFIKKTKSFVTYFDIDSVIFHDKDSKISYTPHLPSKIIELENTGVKLCFYEKCLNIYNKYPLVRMGGVIYNQRIVWDYKISNESIYDLIIDFPIGSLSLPITRETIETTSLNRSSFMYVEDQIKKIIEADLNSLRNTEFKMYDLLNNDLVDFNSHKYINGEYFQFKFEVINSQVINNIYCLRIAHKNVRTNKININSLRHTSLYKHDESFNIYVIPPYSSLRDREVLLKIRKLHNYLGKDFIFMNEKIYDEFFISNIDYSNINFIKYKDIKFPPKIKNNNSNTKDSSISAIYYIRRINQGIITTQKLAEQNELVEPDWWKDPNITRTHLHKHTICLKKQYRDDNHHIVLVNSVKFKDEMISKYNWIAYGSLEYHHAINTITSKEKEANLLINNNRIFTQIYKNVLRPKTLELVNKNIRHSTRLRNFLTKLQNEGTTRSHIINMYNLICRNYITTDKIPSREHFANILKLK